MRVFTEDINSLFNSAMQEFEKHAGIYLTRGKHSEYFEEFSKHLEKKTGIPVNADTLYKQFFIRLKSWDKPEIGYSIDYLNVISKYVYNTDFNNKFKVVFEDDSEIPEFPWNHPAFPATPAVKVQLNGYNNVWIKDESHNPTGVHKDRLAWEVYLFYLGMIKDGLSKDRRLKLPRLSLLSSGNAALSIQFILTTFGLPNLKVLHDPNFIEPEVYNALINSGCELYSNDLEAKKLNSEDILKLTRNEDGIDLTYSEFIDKFSFYDWLSYEVLNLNPQFCFVPFGSGELYKNILEINDKEIMSKRSSKRFFGNKEILSKCSFLGARAKEKDTKMKMLYAKFNKLNISDFKYYFDRGTCSKLSQIEFVNENGEYLMGALNIANANKINCEPSGIAGLALFLQLKDELNVQINDKVVIINTGKIKLDLFK